MIQTSRTVMARADTATADVPFENAISRNRLSRRWRYALSWSRGLICTPSFGRYDFQAASFSTDKYLLAINDSIIASISTNSKPYRHRLHALPGFAGSSL